MKKLNELKEGTIFKPLGYDCDTKYEKIGVSMGLILVRDLTTNDEVHMMLTQRVDIIEEATTFNYVGEFYVPAWVVDGCPQSGSCDAYIEEAMEDERVKEIMDGFTPEDIARELEEYGAWSDEELKDKQANKERLLWIAIFNILDERMEQE